MATDDNGQDLSGYNFAADGFRAAAADAAGAGDVYMAAGGNLYFFKKCSLIFEFLI